MMAPHYKVPWRSDTVRLLLLTTAPGLNVVVLVVGPVYVRFYLTSPSRGRPTSGRRKLQTNEFQGYKFYSSVFVMVFDVSDYVGICGFICNKTLANNYYYYYQRQGDVCGELSRGRGLLYSLQVAIDDDCRFPPDFVFLSHSKECWSGSRRRRPYTPYYVSRLLVSDINLCGLMHNRRDRYVCGR